MEDLIITILRQGGLAFLGMHITRALQQKEISDIIQASGWAAIGISGLKMISSWIGAIQGVGDNFGGKLSWIGNLIGIK